MKAKNGRPALGKHARTSFLSIAVTAEDKAQWRAADPKLRVLKIQNAIRSLKPKTSEIKNENIGDTK